MLDAAVRSDTAAIPTAAQPDDDDTFLIQITADKLRHAILMGLLEVNDHNERCLTTQCPAAEELADVADRAKMPALFDLLGVR